MHVCGLFLSISIPFSKARAVTLEGWQSLHLLSERRGRHAGTGGANNKHMFYGHLCIYDDVRQCKNTHTYTYSYIYILIYIYMPGLSSSWHLLNKHVGRSKSQGVECHFMQQDGLCCIVCWPWLDHSSHSSSWSQARLLSLHAVVKKPYGCIFAHASHTYTLINLGRDMMRHVLFHRFAHTCLATAPATYPRTLCSDLLILSDRAPCGYRAGDEC